MVGGALADISGSYRMPFYVSGLVSLLAFAVCMALVPENFTPPKETKARGSSWKAMRVLTRSPGMAALVMVLLMCQFGVQAIYPVITLFVVDLIGQRPELATLSGVAFSVTGIAGVFAVPLMGRASDRIGERTVLLVALIGAALATAPQAFTDNYWLFVAERFAVGLFVGAIVPTANALIGRSTAPAERGFTFGLTQSAYFLGNSFGPMTGGVVGAAFGLHWVFLITAMLLGAAGVAVWRYVPGRQA